MRVFSTLVPRSNKNESRMRVDESCIFYQLSSSFCRGFTPLQFLQYAADLLQVSEIWSTIYREDGTLTSLRSQPDNLVMLCKYFWGHRYCSCKNNELDFDPVKISLQNLWPQITNLVLHTQVTIPPTYSDSRGLTDYNSSIFDQVCTKRVYLYFLFCSFLSNISISRDYEKSRIMFPLMLKKGPLWFQ
jgi:hypothetical protein